MSTPKPLTILFFASAQTATSLSTLSFPLPQTPAPSSTPPQPQPYTLSNLAADLVERFPKLGKVLESASWAVDEEMVGEEEVGGWVLKGGETVAVLPPVSGG